MGGFDDQWAQHHDRRLASQLQIAERAATRDARSASPGEPHVRRQRRIRLRQAVIRRARQGRR